MTDLEITRLCAAAMGIRVQLIAEPEFHHSDCPYYCIPTLGEGPNPKYEPMHDDAQCMALVKRFKMLVHGVPRHGYPNWSVSINNYNDSETVSLGQNADLNRAICLCVAKMQQPKP